jgi:hypothetical protein
MPADVPARRVLVLYWCDPFRRLRPAVRQHLRWFEASPAGHAVTYVNAALGVPGFVRAAPFDVIALHTTLLCARWFPTFAAIRADLAWVAAHPAGKVAFPQDEYDHAHVLDAWLADLGVELVATNFAAAHRPALYPRLHRSARFVQVLTGYIDGDAARRLAPTLRPTADRPLDIVYRATRLPYWFGRHGQLKAEVADRVRAGAGRLGLRVDISTDPADVIQSDRWYAFLASGRATIGCESGASALDARGEIQAALRRLLTDRPDLTFEDVSARLPPGWDGHRFYAIGPRHLEAIITRTCQVLVEGEYDNLLQPGRHYLPLRRDWANLDEVLAQVRDTALLERVAQRAYEDVYLSGRVTYAAAAAALDRELPGKAGPARPMADRLLRWRVRLAGGLRLAARAVRGARNRARRRLARRPGSQPALPVPGPPSGG